MMREPSPIWAGNREECIGCYRVETIPASHGTREDLGALRRRAAPEVP